MVCERQGEICRLYCSLRAATTHVGMSPDCHALGLGVREISVAAGTGADVMAGGAGAAGPTLDVRHQLPGYPYLLLYNTGYPGLSLDIQTYPQNKVIPGYPELSRDNPTWCLSRDNP